MRSNMQSFSSRQRDEREKKRQQTMAMDSPHTCLSIYQSRCSVSVDSSFSSRVDRDILAFLDRQQTRYQCGISHQCRARWRTSRRARGSAMIVSMGLTVSLSLSRTQFNWMTTLKRRSSRIGLAEDNTLWEKMKDLVVVVFDFQGHTSAPEKHSN